VVPPGEEPITSAHYAVVFHPGPACYPRHMDLRLMLVIFLVAAGCGDDGSFEYMDDDVPNPVCETEDAAACSEVDECSSSVECVEGSFCRANVTGTERGALRCEAACVPALDEASWCEDDASCCDVGATCNVRGYCVLPE